MTRNELNEMIALAARLQAASEPAVLATLFATNGSSYRPLGSMMLGAASSALSAGGVSGGCLEEHIARRGRMLTEHQPAALMRFESDPDADASGAPSLGCGGSIEVLVERVTPHHLAFLREFTAAHDADPPSTAICILDTQASSAIAVRRTLLAGDISTRDLDPEMKALRRQALLAERSLQAPIAAGVRALVQYIRPLVRLVILGAGNDARPLCQLGRSLGWHVCVADCRARLATRGRFPDADQVVAADWWTALRSITFTDHTAVVVLTHDTSDDSEILPQLADRPAAYIGVLGPAHRRDWLLQNAAQMADLPSSFADRVRGPIGLDLGERSPAGIAVSIVAEILAELNDRTAAPLSQTKAARSAAAESTVRRPPMAESWHIHEANGR